MAKGTCGSPTVFFVLLVFVFLLVVYAFYSHPTLLRDKEKFALSNDAIIPKDKLFVYQGVGIPYEEEPTSVQWDDDKSLPTIDGDKDSSNAMFMMTYNKCDPSCCPSTYSCSGGCVCMTDKQKSFIGSRGHNNKVSSCGGFSEI